MVSVTAPLWVGLLIGAAFRAGSIGRCNTGLLE